MTNDPTTAPIGEADMPQNGAAKTARGARAVADEAIQETRAFVDKTLDKAGANEKLQALTDKVNAMRDQMQQSADAAKDWATKQAGAAKDAAQQLHAERPLVVLSVSAGAALAVGLVAGFFIGRATADDY